MQGIMRRNGRPLPPRAGRGGSATRPGRGAQSSSEMGTAAAVWMKE